jgi:hypothetical protein
LLWLDRDLHQRSTHEASTLTIIPHMRFLKWFKIVFWYIFIFVVFPSFCSYTLWRIVFIPSLYWSKIYQNKKITIILGELIMITIFVFTATILLNYCWKWHSTPWPPLSIFVIDTGSNTGPVGVFCFLFLFLFLFFFFPLCYVLFF